MLCKSKVKDIVAALKEELLFVEAISCDAETEITGIYTDSRKVLPDSVFVCIKGFQTDGHQYVPQAVEKGSLLVVAEEHLDTDIATIIVTNSRKAAAVLARLLYRDPSNAFKLIGITGTNGKTTITHLIKHIIRQAGYHCATIGTLGYTINDETYRIERTTPDIIELYSILSDFRGREIPFVVMEVSSHALALDRVYGLRFDYAVFTNLSHDHLDFHKSMHEYGEAKSLLFRYLDQNNGTAIINYDDEFGKRIRDMISCRTIGISFKIADVMIDNIHTDFDLTEFDLRQNNHVAHFKTQLIGKHNIFNVAAALVTIRNLLPELKLETMAKYLETKKTIEGRLSRIENSHHLGIYIDYAHTPHALENVLSTLNTLKRRRLISLFGAGGNRDRGKRPKMMQAALEYSDLVIITNDNPRHEDPATIIADILAEQYIDKPYWIIRDRNLAIRTAIRLAREGDIILIAGKGHEKYQEIGDRKLPFNDAEIAADALVEKGSPCRTKLDVPLDLLMVKKILCKKLANCSERYFTEISTDSRTIGEDALFVAIEGDNFDGHDFAKDVLKYENCHAIVHKEIPNYTRKTIKVDSTISALGLLANCYRKLFDIPVIGITGSVGKSTTKEYTYNIFSQLAPSLKTHANENNLIGVPLTLLRLNQQHRYAIVELGSNQPGEIETIAKISEPTVGIITSISASHLEFLGDIQGVFREKIALFDAEPELRFVHGDNELLEKVNAHRVGYSEQCDFRITNVQIYDDSCTFELNGVRYKIPTPFDTFIINAAFAIAVARRMHVPSEIIQKGLNLKLDIDNRMQIIKTDKYTILNDCYNANPDSMKAAIEFWSRFQPHSPHIAILGDMLELGALTEKLHRDIWKCLKNKKYEYVVGVGEYAKQYQADKHFADVDALIASQIHRSFPENAVVLIKASRGIMLEKIVERLKI